MGSWCRFVLEVPCLEYLSIVERSADMSFEFWLSFVLILIASEGCVSTRFIGF